MVVSRCIVFIIALANLVHYADSHSVHTHSDNSVSSRHLLQTAGTECLTSGNTISSDDDPNYLVSDSGVYFIRVESTGQIVIYEGGLNARDELQRIPTTASAEDVYTLEITPDHILQLVASDGTTTIPISDNTPDAGNPDNAKFVIQPTGNIVLLDLDTNMPIWTVDDPVTTRVTFAVADDYAAAQIVCAPFGLYTIRNENDILTLRAAAADAGDGLTGSIWVGIDDLDTMDGMWVFDDGSCCVNELNDCEELDWWATGEPADSADDCAAFDLDEADNTMVLTATDCTTDLRFACNARDVSDTDCSSDEPTLMPSADPSAAPSSSPSETPTTTPSSSPTSTPSTSPSETPTATPSSSPTTTPSSSPSIPPTMFPSGSPSSSPSQFPSGSPTATPSQAPTTPTNTPSTSPSLSPTTPTSNPSTTPTTTPSTSPSVAPTTPSLAPTAATDGPTAAPAAPLRVPSASPSSAPTPCTQSDLWPILSFIFPDNIACNILFEILPTSILEALVGLYRARICAALELFDLTEEQLAEFLRLLMTTLETLDCDNIDISGSIPGIGSESAESDESVSLSSIIGSISLPGVISGSGSGSESS